MKDRWNTVVAMVFLLMACTTSGPSCRWCMREIPERSDDAMAENASEDRSASERDGNSSRAVAPRTSHRSRTLDVTFVPSPQVAVDKMLELAEIRPGEVLYDLGCGDGRIVVTAGKRYGIKARGFDIDPQRVKESMENVRKNRLGNLVTITEADIFKLDLTEADVVTLYLLPKLNVDLMPQLSLLKKGARIISYEFDMQGARPALVHRDKLGKEQEHVFYKWVVPWEPDPQGASREIPQYLPRPR